MRDVPIIFSAPMVLAMLREVDKPGTGKTMTRRLAWVERKLVCGEKASPWQKLKPRDRLWVRESLKNSQTGWLYAADGRLIEMSPRDPRVPGMVAWAHHYDHDSAPSIHMPRVLSRLTLIVASTKIERLDVITEADAIAEGALFHDGHGVGHSGWRHDPSHGYVHSSARVSFACLWDQLHGEGAFNACAEVVAITFRPALANIDALPKAEAA